VLVKTPFVVAGKNKQLLGLEGAVEEGENTLLSLLLKDLLKLVQDNDAGLGDRGEEGIEPVSAILTIDEDSGQTGVDADLTGEESLAGTLFTHQQYPCIALSAVIGVQNPLAVLQAITVDLAFSHIGLSLFQIETLHRVELEDIVADREGL
jgi:hypothetical protein